MGDEPRRDDKSPKQACSRDNGCYYTDNRGRDKGSYKRSNRNAEGQAQLDHATPGAACSKCCDGVEHPDEIGGGIRVCSIARPVFELKSPRQFQSLRLKLLALVACAVFEDRIDRFPGDVPHNLPKA